MGPKDKKAPEHTEADEAADSQPEDEIAWLTKDVNMESTMMTLTDLSSALGFRPLCLPPEYPHGSHTC